MKKILIMLIAAIMAGGCQTIYPAESEYKYPKKRSFKGYEWKSDRKDKPYPKSYKFKKRSKRKPNV